MLPTRDEQQSFMNFFAFLRIADEDSGGAIWVTSQIMTCGAAGVPNLPVFWEGWNAAQSVKMRQSEPGGA